MRSLVRIVVECLSLATLGVAFAAKVTVSELMFVCFGSAVALAALETVRKCEPIRFRPSAGWLIGAWMLPGLVVKGCWTLAIEMGRRVLGAPKRSGLFTAAFHSRGNEARSASRRALAAIFGSLPPNSIVVGIEEGEDTIVVHEMRPEPLPKTLRALES